MSPRPLPGRFGRLPAGMSPALRALEKKKYFPSGDRYGEISRPGPLTFGPRFLAGVHSPSFRLLMYKSPPPRLSGRPRAMNTRKLSSGATQPSNSSAAVLMFGPRFSGSANLPSTRRERYRSVFPRPPGRPEPKYSVPLAATVGNHSLAAVFTGAPRFRGSPQSPSSLRSITQMSMSFF